MPVVDAGDALVKNAYHYISIEDNMMEMKTLGQALIRKALW